MLCSAVAADIFFRDNSFVLFRGFGDEMASLLVSRWQ
jgi:hypothetical protein